MKRKYGDRRDWHRITQKSYHQTYLNSEDYTGYITLYIIEDLREALHQNIKGFTYCIADKGYSWLQHFPKGEHYTITSMFNHYGELIQCYIDICVRHGTTIEGIPWLDDMYLDIIVTPNGRYKILDADELDDALADGSITHEEYLHAWDVTNNLIEKIKHDELQLLKQCLIHRQQCFQL